MLRSRFLSPASALAALLAWSGCTTDSPKISGGTDAGDALPTTQAPDADPAPVPTDATDAGPGPVADAGDATPDAGATAAKAPAATSVDAGPTAAKPTTGGGVGGAGASGAAVKAGVYDKILVKPKDPALSADAVKALVEEKTGQQVSLVRRTAGKWYLLQLAPKAGGRSAEEQKKVVAALRQVDAFKSVEADRLMQVKTP